MKITIKTTQQKVFHVRISSISPKSISYFLLQVDLDGSDTIAVLKAKIYESQGHPVAVQKIIYSGNHPPKIDAYTSHILLGKILTDDKTVESCGIKEKDFLVLMVSKVSHPCSSVPA